MKAFRSLLVALGWLAVIMPAGAQAADTAASAPSVVRLAVVNTPFDSGLVDMLVKGFEATQPHRVEVRSGSDVFARARAGEADIVIAHYGKDEADLFVMDGFGRWPRLVFANQAVLVGPASDPAGVRGQASAAAAFARIAAARAPFIAMPNRTVAYLTDTLWEMAGRPDKTGWFQSPGESNGRAVRLAAEQQGYTIWGAIPFLKFRTKSGVPMDIMVANDPMLQRVMASILVRADKVPGVNEAGAAAFEAYLLEPATQAAIAGFRNSDYDGQLWWPAGRNN